jgi:hypothetical protein
MLVQRLTAAAGGPYHDTWVSCAELALPAEDLRALRLLRRAFPAE